jgi:histidine triad (HIT) family protein|tara:strand:+ start:1560 stop:1955 length:396 start_codon:yes stop_codon:yes gene_type:complete
MTSVFSKIIDRKLPAYIVSENSSFIAFLDINPLILGHTLVVPKKQIDYFFNLDDKSLSDIILFSKKVSKALKKVTKCKRVGMSVIGLEVPHAHIHLVPLNKMDDMNFGKKRVLPSSSELISICKKIQSEII